MSKDFSWIIEPSSVDEEFKYVDELSESQNRYISPEQYLQLDGSALGMESLEETMYRVDPFGDPTYYKSPEPNSCSWIKQDPSIAHEATSQYRPSFSLRTGIRVNHMTLKNSSKMAKSEFDESFQPLNEELSSGQMKVSKPKTSKTNKIKKSKKPKRDQYPTKNFLPSFRSSFLNYIAKWLDNQGYFNSFEIVKRIKGKPCINLQDYQDLFNQPEFRPILQEYFKNKVIARDLMQSRIEYSTKCEYFKRIHVFEEAFESRVFTKINY